MITVIHLALALAHENCALCGAFAENVGDWDDFDWGWKEDVQEGENEETELQCWLQECHISMSPVGDLIAVASGERIVHFTR